VKLKTSTLLHKFNEYDFVSFSFGDYSNDADEAYFSLQLVDF